MDVDDDSFLEAALLRQKRPSRPGTLGEARDLVEAQIAAGLGRAMSPPEARVEATRVMAWYETLIRSSRSETPTRREPHEVVFGLRVTGWEPYDFVDEGPSEGPVSTLLSGADEAETSQTFLVIEASRTEVESTEATLIRSWLPEEDSCGTWVRMLRRAAEEMGAREAEDPPGWIFLPGR